MKTTHLVIHPSLPSIRPKMKEAPQIAFGLNFSLSLLIINPFCFHRIHIAIVAQASASARA